MSDIEDISSKSSVECKIKESFSFSKHVKPDEDAMLMFMGEFLEKTLGLGSKGLIDRVFNTLKTKHKISCSKGDMREAYEKDFAHMVLSPLLKSWLIKKAMRANSGVLVVTIVLSPHKFSCKYDCSYCPQETDLKGVPTQPRSYLSSEPAMLRAIGTRAPSNQESYDFDVKNQFQNRIQAYEHMGSLGPKGQGPKGQGPKGQGPKGPSSHKMEIILSGGTWESYPLAYREQVIQELYWSANTMGTEMQRPMLPLAAEQTINETSPYRIIGLTLETRPDNITPANIQDYVRWGVTRIQIGVQHFDDAILRGVNRKCYTAHTVAAIRLLKQAGFKVVVHLMPDLPGSSVEKDKWMFEQALTNPDLQFDDVKIYPTAICKSSDEDRLVKSKIADWYAAGTYVPYAEKNLDDLLDVLRSYKTRVQPWVRIQRLVRDIPSKSIESGYKKISNLRQILKDKMKVAGETCRCTFCMEIGDNQFDSALVPRLVVRHYIASGGDEYYFSVEAHRPSYLQNTWYYCDRAANWVTWLATGVWEEWNGCMESYVGLYGFLRLRIDLAPGGDFIPQINGCGLIREVHVYGFSLGIADTHVSVESQSTQHRGYGQLLMGAAEDMIALQGLSRAAVIAGVGTREYYKNKCGYNLQNGYMLKEIGPYNRFWSARAFIVLLMAAAVACLHC
jgi:histone acetyltransferase (RNA polymerase elongator complex component)